MVVFTQVKQLLLAAWCAASTVVIDHRDACPRSYTTGLTRRPPRLELTSAQNASLQCDSEAPRFQAGYAHFENSLGVEDKHMFWWLFEARQSPDTAPVVLMFGGGPGTTGLLNVFQGAGPCTVVSRDDRKGSLAPSAYPWTDTVNIIAVDQPVGVGFSCASKSGLVNSSASAAVDVDDFLQSFWGFFPQFKKNKFVIQAGSYGGTYIPHIVRTIHDRNHAPNHPFRVIKMPEAILMTNVWGDALTNFRWFHKSNCEDRVLFNESTCESMLRTAPACLDAVQLAYEQPTLSYRRDAMRVCNDLRTDAWTDRTDRNPADVRKKCSTFDECYPQFQWFVDTLNSTAIRDAVGVPAHVSFSFLEMEQVKKPFIATGDHIQPSYLLLGPAINDGLRMLVANGMQDALCPWRSNIAWMKLFNTKHQIQFREAKPQAYPGVGDIQQVGDGAGDYTFIRIAESGHFVQRDQPKIFREIVMKWINNEPFV